MAARSPRKVRDRTQQNIEKIKEQREARREQMEAEKAARAASRAQMEAAGTPGDVDFQRLVHDWRVGRGAEEEAHIPPGNVRINIVARKRPIGRKEVSRQEYDVVTCLNPTVVVHYPKTKVDGITKYLENQTFEFDHVSGARVSPGNGHCCRTACTPAVLRRRFTKVVPQTWCMSTQCCHSWRTFSRRGGGPLASRTGRQAVARPTRCLACS